MTDPNDVTEPIHARMPVVLPREAESEWLSADVDTYKELCQTIQRTIRTPTGFRRGSKPANDDPRVIEPLNHEESGLGEFRSR